MQSLKKYTCFKKIEGNKLEHPVTSRLNKNEVICILSIYIEYIFNTLKIIHSVASSSVSLKHICSPPMAAFHAPTVIRKVCLPHATLLRKLQRVLPLTSPMMSKATCMQPSPQQRWALHCNRHWGCKRASWWLYWFYLSYSHSKKMEITTPTE